ncbi:MAG: DUF819 family protein [Bacteroidales bacterium]|nr:DUF819 family protein [Bacteroidales bacterium]
MKILILLAAAAFYLIVPALVVKLCRRVSFFRKAGAILTLYFLGVLIANLFIFRVDRLGETLFPLQDAMVSVAIPLAIPMILFACDFRHWPAGKALLALLVGIVSVFTVSFLGYQLFGSHLGEQGKAIAGMAVGVYTGGTPNLAAIKMMLGVDEATYVSVNTFDMVVSFLYLVFLLSVGIRLVRKWLPFEALSGPSVPAEDAVVNGAMAQSEQDMYRDIFTKRHFRPTVEALALSIAIVGGSLGLSFLITGKVNMIVLILSLTTLSLAASFIPRVRSWEKSYDAGMYLVLVFSLVVSSMVDLGSIDYRAGAFTFLFIAFVIFASLGLQLLLGKLLKLDADTTVITSVAMINSPLFVPMIADAMKNRKVILTGITAGIIGYAVGNYLGVLMAQIL